jgi:hypothetical protein
MTAISFGQVIPVTGPNLGFPGTISRQGERVAPSRQFVPFNPALNLNFGDPAVIIENAQGGFYTSVADFVAASVSNIGLIVEQWAGMAVREVQTQLAYPFGAGVVPGTLQVGYYASGQMADVLERGSGTVPVSVANSPVSGSQVYTRVLANANVPAGFVGDWEVGVPVASDLFTQEATTQTQGSANITLASGTNTVNGQSVSGAGIQPGTYIVSGGGTTAIVLSQPASFTSAGNLLTFSNLVALPRTVAKTGFVDANSMIEITIKVRNAA